MANSKQTFSTILFYNQMIDGQFVASVRVRIFKSVKLIPSSSKMELVATDGNTTQKYPDSSLTHISKYHYVVLSSGICEEQSSHAEAPLYLRINVYLTDDFDVSMLDNKSFFGKFYVIKALQEKTELKPVLSPLLRYLQQKVGDNYYEKLYTLLKAFAHSYDFDKVEQLFKKYKITDKPQALFWKEMYEKTQNQK